MSNETITLADIFALFKESERQREAEQAEQKRLSQERQQEYEQRQQEYEQRQREHEERQRKHEEDMEQFRISMEETRKMVAETNKHMGSITSRWGEFVENLVRPAAVRLFKEQGINVHYTSLQVKAHDYKGSIEIDIWAENDGEIVAIEVKSHLKVRDIKRFIKVLDRFKDIFPKYKNYRLYGAVAGIKVDEKADQYALEQGLFLIRPAGDSVAIDMKEDFQAKVW
ncbi:DUF3782 domain-containing protein [Cylindrospermopsis raciborskii]|jgi:hypothetical protein|uniref:DUF3782 domain-containing protein n=1 Tax=Cylindrospermopsis raciborskii TaxID=77022 RepID=UPI001F2A9E79|nr:DUF3782 domain-containing protein [Cylindrospermopsis raciborskii]UJS03888.1 DUF3782 domain-containing protein [Cylindrospermopsis raciborskii KLL07]